MQVCRCAGVQVCRCAGVQVCKYAWVQVYRCVGVQGYRCTGEDGTGVQVCRCAGVQVCRCAGEDRTGVQVPRCHTCEEPLCIQCEHGLNGHVSRVEPIVLEHHLQDCKFDICHLAAVTSIIFCLFLSGFMGGSVSMILHSFGSRFIFSGPKV